jgi:Holliday junction resolvase RusA-like endonuclease
MEKSMTITLLGEPKSSQHIYKYHCKFGFPSGYMSAEGKKIKEDYGWQAKSQWKGGVQEGKLSVAINLYFKSKIHHDIDNYGKLLLDSLTGICYTDDRQIEQMMVTKYHDAKNPRIEIEILNL